MKKLLVLIILFITSCSTKDKLSITNENELFSLTKDNALVVCGGCHVRGGSVVLKGSKSLKLSDLEKEK